MIIKSQGKYIVYEGTYTAEYELSFRQAGIIDGELILRVNISSAEKSNDIVAVLLEYENGTLDDTTKGKLNEVADNYFARCIKEGYLNTNHFKRYMNKVMSERIMEEE